MLPFSKMSDEDLETVSGGMVAGLKEISGMDGIVVPEPEPVPDPFPSPVLWVSPT